MSRTIEDPEALLPVVKDLRTAIFAVAEASEGKSGMKPSEKGPETRTSEREPGAKPSEKKHETKPSGTTSRRTMPTLAEREKQTITYDIRWNVGRSERRGFGRRGVASSNGPYAELIVSCPAPVTPQLKLVYRKDGHVPMSETNPGLAVLHTIAPFPKGFPDGRYICAFNADAFRGLRPGTQLRLMLCQKDIGSYYMRIKSVENLKVPELKRG